MHAEKHKANIGVLASGSGTNLQALIDAVKSGRLQASVDIVISNNSAAGALQRACRYGIHTEHISTVTHPNAAARDEAIASALCRNRVDLVVLAGYMKKLGPATLSRYRNRIINIHPALLPAFGGSGMYGDRVHEAVLKAGDTITGATVHLVNEEYDEGPIIAQTPVPVTPDDTVRSLQRRVLAAEHELIVGAVDGLITGDIAVFQQDTAGSKVTFVVRRITTAGDADRLRQLCAAECAGGSDTVPALTPNRTNDWFGLFAGNELVGAAALSVSDGDSSQAKLTALCVGRPWRRKGLGSELLGHVEWYADKAGASVLVAANPENAENWFVDRGYTSRAGGEVAKCLRKEPG